MVRGCLDDGWQQEKTLLPGQSRIPFLHVRTNPIFSDVNRLLKELQFIMSGANTFKDFLPNNNLFSPDNSFLFSTLQLRNINIYSKVGAGVDLQAAADFMTQGSWCW